MWGMRRNPSGWSQPQLNAMHWLQRSTLKSARAWRLKMALREVYTAACDHSNLEQASADLRAWLSWARRCRLEPFKRPPPCRAASRPSRAARGLRTSATFIAVAYLRVSKLKHLPAHPFSPAGA